MDRARVVADLGRYDRARPDIEHAVGLLEREAELITGEQIGAQSGWCALVGKDPGLAQSLAHTYTSYAMRLSELDERGVACEQAKRAVELYRLIPPRHLDEGAVEQGLSNLSKALGRVGYRRESIRVGQEALKRAERYAAEDRIPSVLAMIRRRMSVAYASLGQHEKAIEMAKKAKEDYERLALAKPQRFDPDFAKALTNLAERYLDASEWKGAQEEAGTAVELWRRLARSDSVAFCGQLSRSLAALSRAWSVETTSDLGIRCAEEALAVLPANSRFHEVERAEGLLALAEALTVHGQPGAEAPAREAVGIYRVLSVSAVTGSSRFLVIDFRDD